jgi:hypothetical protein
MTVFDQGSQKERAEIMQAEAKLRHASQEPPKPTTFFAIAQQSNSTKPHEPVPTLRLACPLAHLGPETLWARSHLSMEVGRVTPSDTQ